ncbi:uncharacterized protein isoform X1 [Leptinotarsa decemlineata]|uniref:uncharacterized protein isoform X1 n=2 Tax=Leptinotarsa decemlineata TaxID=7539 RepID=UPI003D30403D
MGFCNVYQCDVCLARKSVRSLPLLGYERILALKLINSANEYMQVRKPPKSCVTCIKKLRFFNTRLINNPKEKITNRSDLSQFKMYPQGFSPFKSDDTLEPNTEESPESYLSQYFSLTPEEVGSSKGQSMSESRLNAEDNEHMNMEEPCLNDYNCKCENCQNKYGSLPILLQGIEQKSLSHKTEPQPSTSSQKVPKKVLTCEYCKKTFTHKGDFNKHLRKHTREKPFSCTVCNRKFAHTSNLQRHQRLHSGFKPFVCDLCNKTFSRKDKLDCHRRSRICSGTSSSTVPE